MSASLTSAMKSLTVDTVPDDRLFFAYNGEVVHHDSPEQPYKPRPQFIDFQHSAVIAHCESD